MGDGPDIKRETGTTLPSPSGDAAPSRPRRLALAARIAIALAIVVLLSLAIDFASSSPALCRSCHAMAPRAETWSQSTHAEVACVSCHQPPTEWYELPQRLVARARLFGRDVRWQLGGRPAETTRETTPAVGPVSSGNCLRCHDPKRKATSGFRIKIDHAEHARRNGDCLSCHVNTAHPEPTRGTPLSLMDQCFKCHGTAEQPDASAACSLCHPRDYELRPASHEVPNWKDTKHGELAKADRAQCALCHQASFCTNCHGLEMPHPSAWAKKGAASHAVFAESNREVCARCHVEKPDLCSMCHHEGWDPGKGPWVTQHPLMVGKRGADFCMRCHTRAYCSFCHVTTSMSISSSPTTQ